MAKNKIDITSTVLESTIDGAKGFLGKLLGASVEEYGLMLADNVKLRRFKNQLKMVSKAQKIVEESGINIKQISIKQLVPLLEYSSLEEDESLQDKWANMLVNYVDIEKVYESSIYPYILSQLSTEEIKMLLYIYDKRNEATISIDKGVIKANLERLGLIEFKYSTKMLTLDSRFYQKNSVCSLTELGKEFIECCSKV